MLFIPGGNFQFLDASTPVYNSEHLVNTTNVIIVFIQYRLGEYTFFYDDIINKYNKIQVYLDFLLLDRVLMISKGTMVYSINVLLLHGSKKILVHLEEIQTRFEYSIDESQTYRICRLLYLVKVLEDNQLHYIMLQMICNHFSSELLFKVHQ
jgi:hypothetical protein